MRFSLQVDLVIEGVRNSLGGYFNASQEYEIPAIAYQFIKQIKRNTGYRETCIQNVMVGGIEDITDKVIDIENKPILDLDCLW
jgi:hypothetical protein